jgi:hypothetical protein
MATGHIQNALKQPLVQNPNAIHQAGQEYVADQHQAQADDTLKKTCVEVAEHFRQKGFSPYAQRFIDHNVTGVVLLQLRIEDLKEMGVDRVGDRHLIMAEIESMKSVARLVWRNKTIREIEEIYPHNAFVWLCQTCCGACPPQMDKYRLTSTSLKVTKTVACKLCNINMPCCGVSVVNDTQPLDKILDVDTANFQNGMCDNPKTLVTCNLMPFTKSDNVGGGAEGAVAASATPAMQMMVDFSQGEIFASEIRNQIEEYKRQLMQFSKQ